MQAVLLDADLTASAAPALKETLSAKVDLAATVAPALGTAAAVLQNKGDDPVQLAADALQLGADTVAAKTVAAAPLSGSSQLITGMKKAMDGDAAGATLAIAVAGEKLSPRLSGGFGAVAGLMTLGIGKNTLIERWRATVSKFKAVFVPSTQGANRLDLALDAGLQAREVALVGHSLVHAAIKVVKNSVRVLGKVRAFAPTAQSLVAVGRGMAETPMARAFSVANRWLPALNVAGVFLSAKTLLDVGRDSQASTRTKVLAIGSLLTSGFALWVGFSAALLPLLGSVVLSIALDLGLSASRKRDHAEARGASPQRLPIESRQLTSERHFGVA
jgi:hypothetical protein